MERDTQQRRAIRQVFLDNPRPLAPQDVLEYAQGNVTRLGIATVYRNLKALESEGWLAPVSLPGQPVLYERSGLDHHHHFHCTRCGKVFDVNDCPGNIKKLAPKGFVVERHELTLYGVCKSCSPAR